MPRSARRSGEGTFQKGGPAGTVFWARARRRWKALQIAGHPSNRTRPRGDAADLCSRCIRAGEGPGVARANVVAGNLALSVRGTRTDVERAGMQRGMTERE